MEGEVKKPKEIKSMRKPAIMYDIFFRRYITFRGNRCTFYFFDESLFTLNIFPCRMYIILYFPNQQFHAVYVTQVIY